jgi:5-methylcytosine-specific restriction endonuclease McrA
MCSQDEYWMGKKISLILDHINGINDDNRIDNLRILCPNCNSTLDTNGGKNIKNKLKQV